MAISYNILWKLLIDKKMSKAELQRATSVSSNTMTKLNKNEEVNLSAQTKICDVLSVDIGDIINTPATPKQEEN